MGNTDKARQQAYRRRMQEQGYRQFAFWLDEYAQTALKLLQTYDSSGPDLSTLVNEAIRHYHAYKLSQDVSSNATSNTSDVTSDTITIATNVPGNVISNAPIVSSNVISNRYMTQGLEDYILGLRQAGMTLNEVAQRLFNEGYQNTKGGPYSTGTLSKAEARAKARQSL